MQEQTCILQTFSLCFLLFLYDSDHHLCFGQLRLITGLEADQWCLVSKCSMQLLSILQCFRDLVLVAKQVILDVPLFSNIQFASRRSQDVPRPNEICTPFREFLVYLEVFPQWPGKPAKTPNHAQMMPEPPQLVTFDRKEQRLLQAPSGLRAPHLTSQHAQVTHWHHKPRSSCHRLIKSFITTVQLNAHVTAVTNLSPFLHHL